MARTLTGGVGCVARWPTRRQVASALRRGRPVRRRDCVRLSLSLRRIPRRCLHDFGCFRSRCSIAHASTSGIGIAARASPPSLPPLPALIVVPLASRLRMSGSCGLPPPPPPSFQSMSIFATVFSHLFYQLCSSPPPPLPPSPPALFCSDRSHYKQTRLILRLQLSAVSVIVSSPAPTLLRGKCVVIYCFITLALMGGNILHPPPLLAFIGPPVRTLA